jgi:signal transduction histidine kinase
MNWGMHLKSSATELGLFRSVVETVREPLLVLDKDLRVILANSAFVQRFASDGLPEGASLFELHEGLFDLQELRHLLEETLATDSSFEDFAVTVADVGRSRRFLLNGRIVEERSGEPLVLLAMEDATEKQLVADLASDLNVDLEARVVARTAELEQAVAELEAFSYSVSHDLRAPLRAIDGYSRILSTEHAGELSPEGLRYLGLARAGAEQMGQLIDGLLAFSRLGRQEVSFRPVDLRRLVEEVLASRQEEIATRRVAIEVQALPPVQADPLLLRQVLVNLIDNALKYTRNVEGARVTIGTELTRGAESIFVRDNGIGFDPKFAGNLFGVFHRLHRAEDFEGTGVGLALTRRIVERHGGKIWAEAEEGLGATFFFTLGGEHR